VTVLIFSIIFGIVTTLVLQIRTSQERHGHGIAGFERIRHFEVISAWSGICLLSSVSPIFQDVTRNIGVDSQMSSIRQD